MGRRGASLVYPNSKHSPAGTRFDFWNYDPDQKGWYIYGKGTVTGDGTRVVPDPGVVIYEFTGAMVASPSMAPTNGPQPGNPNDNDGDPVDLSTGLFVLNKTDLFLPDILSINLTRTYRPGDSMSRAFGIGATHLYDMFLIGDLNPWTYAELVLPDGGRIHYDRTSPGSEFTDAVYEHKSTPTIFYGSTISWNGIGWDLKLKNGTVLNFLDGFAATTPRQAALYAIHDRYGNTLQLTRDGGIALRTDGSYNLTDITSPNGRWIHLTYDSSNRVIQAADNTGRTVSYGYDGGGHLATVTDPNGGRTTYTYDDSDRMLTITDARGIVYLTNEYDIGGRVARQTLADGAIFQFNYTMDSSANITETAITDPRGIIRKVAFNPGGYVVTDSRAAGLPEQQTAAYEWQASTNLLSTFTDALSRRSVYSYDSNGNMTSITRLGNCPVVR
jgi:YD repeat-containing protein